MTNIARLEKVPLRELWKHEAHGFTRWLAENLDYISEVLENQLTFIEREAAAGPFSADILAEDELGNSVVIENQLEQTNHDHLGKLITYMSNLDAKIAIWVASDPRPEHEKAVHWLNETLPADTSFYLLKIEAYKIGNSDPAPKFTIVAGPTKEGKQIGSTKKDLAERHLDRYEFWKQLLEMAKHKTNLLERLSPSYDYWISTGAGTSGIAYSLVIKKHDSQVEYYISKNNAEENKHIFDTLFKKKEEIEKRFGEPLEWQRLDQRIACRICYVINGIGLEDKDNWNNLQEKMIDAFIRLQSAIQTKND